MRLPTCLEVKGQEKVDLDSGQRQIFSIRNLHLDEQHKKTKSGVTPSSIIEVKGLSRRENESAAQEVRRDIGRTSI